MHVVVRVRLVTTGFEANTPSLLTGTAGRSMWAGADVEIETQWAPFGITSDAALHALGCSS